MPCAVGLTRASNEKGSQGGSVLAIGFHAPLLRVRSMRLEWMGRRAQDSPIGLLVTLFAVGVTGVRFYDTHRSDESVEPVALRRAA